MIKTRPITVRIPTTPSRVRSIEAAMMEEIGDRIEEAFGETVSTWDRKPRFVKKLTVTADKIAVGVFTTDEVYGYVSRGTKPHRIPLALRGQRMRWREGYVAKSTPGVMAAKSGGAKGGYRFFTAKTKYIQHPGTDAREFPKSVKREVSKFVSERFSRMGRKVRMELTP